VSISFNQVPANNLTPGVHTEVDFSGLPGLTPPREVLLVGYDHPASSGVQDTPTIVAGASSPWHRKAQISAMIRAYRRVDPNARITAIALDEPSGGANAAGTIAFAGTATEDGTLEVYVAGKLIQVGVESGDTATEVAAAVAAAITADPDVPVTASASTGTVTITAAFKGSAGNRIPIGISVKDSQRGVAGITPTVTSLASGSGQADLAAALALVSEASYYAIVTGLADSTSLGALTTEVARRWQATVELLGHGFAGFHGTFAEMITEVTSINAAELTIMGAGKSLSPSWEWAAEAAAWDVRKPDPATGYLGYELAGLDAPLLADQPNKGERDALLAAGISTFRVSGTTPVLDRLVTTRTKDAGGDTDLSQLALTARRTTEFLRADWRARILRKFVNYKLADSSDIIPRDGSRILTPAALVDEAIAWFIELRDTRGLVQDLDAFKAALAAQVNGGDPNRLDIFVPPKLVRELVTIASVIQPR
jgi:phage tail sheath gpL-like